MLIVLDVCPHSHLYVSSVYGGAGGAGAAIAIVNPPYTAEQLALEDTFKAMRSMHPLQR